MSTLLETRFNQYLAVGRSNVLFLQLEIARRADELATSPGGEGNASDLSLWLEAETDILSGGGTPGLASPVDVLKSALFQ